MIEIMAAECSVGGNYRTCELTRMARERNVALTFDPKFRATIYEDS